MLKLCFLAALKINVGKDVIFTHDPKVAAVKSATD